MVALSDLGSLGFFGAGRTSESILTQAQLPSRSFARPAFADRA
jgi:hypothetical protein